MIIKGNTVGTTSPRPNWEQTDPNKADYILNKPETFKIVSEVTVNADGGIYFKDGSVNTAIKEGINHLTLILDNDLMFNGTLWELCPDYKALEYYNGTSWVTVDSLNGIGYSKGQCMELEGKWAENRWEYIHILNLPSANTLTETDKTEIAEQVASLIDTSLLSAIGSGVLE